MMKEDIGLFEEIEDQTSLGHPIHNAAKTIKPINKSTVHRICSGQVILSLSTAVKELVENSLDAKATSVVIILKDFGSSSIEVSDNGTGISQDDFQQFALKHSTSKLEEFEDLVDVNTFGFRGEAISSLCSLSNLSVVTRHKSQTIGTKLIYDHSGKIMNNLPMSRQIGTTIILENLFEALPVRHKEFLRNIKKEFNKMVQILYSYCIISTDVRISCTNYDKDKKTVLVSTNGSSTIKDNLSSIFGIKQITPLLQIKEKELCNSTLEEYGLEASRCQKVQDSVYFQGYISSCAHGVGRSSTDRQFYFINSRPCDPIKISRLVNEVYHQYNKYQYPFIILNIKMEADDVDINVTPDKRSIFITIERHLLALLKSTLLQMFEKIPSTYQMQNILQNSASYSPICNILINNRSSPTTKAISSLSTLFSRHHSFKPDSKTKSSLGISIHAVGASSCNSVKDSPVNNKRRKFSKYLEDQSNGDTSPEKKRKLDFAHISDEIEMSQNGNCCRNKTNSSNDVDSYNLNKSTEIFDKPLIVNGQGNKPIESLNSLEKNSTSSIKKDLNSSNNNDTLNVIEFTGKGDEHLLSNNKVDNVIEILDSFEMSGMKKNYLIITLSLDKLKLKLAKNNKHIKNSNICRKFRTKIDPKENNKAEDELKREITKDSFEKMNIIGQFNLGFIIVRLDSDLFIVDQHATDEKYNFELLEKNHVLLQQPMITPQELQLTPVNESILLDNLAIFNQNGFYFNVCHSKCPGRRVSLTSVPQSRAWQFGIQDIEELIFMLSDCPGVFCRPSRIRSMFASRACRQSVMIGTALCSNQMKKLIEHMGQIDHPWNCPHGRPTMRHLINTDMVSDFN